MSRGSVTFRMLAAPLSRAAHRSSPMAKPACGASRAGRIELLVRRSCVLSRNGIVRIEFGLWRLFANMMTMRALIVSAAALGTTTLAGAMLAAALERGYRKVSVAIPADNTGALEMFGKLGFAQEALLREQLCSPQDGSLHDVVLLAYLVDDTWSAVLPGGYEGVLG